MSPVATKILKVPLSPLRLACWLPGLHVVLLLRFCIGFTCIPVFVFGFIIAVCRSIGAVPMLQKGPNDQRNVTGSHCCSPC
jgi:hypothetical protein